jgi:peptidoglycan/LPS O-acetylase OafA/YrhL
MSPRTGRLDSVQALRGLAALAVVLWHASGLVSEYGFGFTRYFQPGSTFGVTLFFVISGFIMTYTTQRTDGSADYAVDFLIRRLARIWPVYFVATVAAMPIIPPLWLTFEWIFKSLTFQPHGVLIGNTPPALGYPVLGVGWTLNYEMYFYLVFGVSLLFGRARYLFLTAWFLATLVALPLAAGKSPTLEPTTAYGFAVTYLNLVTNPIIWLFFVGSLIGLIYSATPLSIPASRLSKAVLLVFAILVGVQWALDFRTLNGVTNAGLSLIPFFALVVLSTKAAPLPVPRPLVYLGDISYSLYLIHSIVIAWYLPIVTAIGVPIVPLTRFIGMAASIAVSLVLAALSHHWIEIKVSAAARNLLRSIVLGSSRPLPVD